MKYYFAPMEGLTGYVYRNVHHKYFGGIDRYYTPFLVPTQTKRFHSRELNDILPEHNEGICVVPQLLTNQADNFSWAAQRIREMGYEEINLNLGCPSGTVVPKKRGSGFLAYPQELDEFLYQICQETDRLGMKLSIKTRIGKDSPEEFMQLLEIYNRYALKLLIVHPRIQTDYYKHEVRRESYELAVKESKNPLCYNGDLFHLGDIEAFKKQFPDTEQLMLGRGLIANPALAQTALGVEGLDKTRLKAFHEELLARYREYMSGDKSVMFKMKELWYYLGGSFLDYENYEKKLKKTKHLEEFLAVVNRIFDECELKEQPGFVNRQNTKKF